MPKISPERKTERRGQILRAAVACFARDGFHATTIKHICAEAGLSAGAVYSYFPTKDAIIQALAQAGQKVSDDTLANGEAPASPARLKELFAAFDQPGAVVANRLDVRLWAEAIDNPALADVYLGSRARLIDALADLAGPAAAPRGLEPRVVAEVVAAALVGCEVQRAIRPESDMRPLLEALIALLEPGRAKAPSRATKKGRRPAGQRPS